MARRFDLPRLGRRRSTGDDAEGAGSPKPPTDGRSGWESLGRIALIVAVLLAAIGGGIAVGYALFDESDEGIPPAVAPTVVIDQLPEPEAVEEIGFPAFATQNTTRVGGPDPTAAAAGVALASYPSTGGVRGPRMTVIAPADSWQASLAATPLVARPIGAPVLLGDRGEIPGFTAQALAALDPTGLKRADGVQVLAINGVASPEGLNTSRVNASDPAVLAKELDRQRTELSGRSEPDHILVVSSEEPELSMPAAAWAARSGDPILFTERDRVPRATLDVIERYPDAPVYVLGPEQAITAEALEQLRAATGRVIRVGNPDPVVNAIEFARFVDGTFGWNINDPGHGFIVANGSRPADAAASALLAGGGKPGPLLLTDSVDELPRALRNFLLDTKPGYAEDPSRAVFNHIWVIGDTGVISLEQQARIDALTALEPIRRGSGVPRFDPDTGGPEAEVDPDADPDSR